MSVYNLKVYFEIDQVSEMKPTFEQYLNLLDSNNDLSPNIDRLRQNKTIGTLSSLDHTVLDYLITISTSVAASTIIKGFFSYAIEKLKARTSKAQNKSLKIHINNCLIEINGETDPTEIDHYIELITKKNIEP